MHPKAIIPTRTGYAYLGSRKTEIPPIARRGRQRCRPLVGRYSKFAFTAGRPGDDNNLYWRGRWMWHNPTDRLPEFDKDPIAWCQRPCQDSSVKPTFFGYFHSAEITYMPFDWGRSEPTRYRKVCASESIWVYRRHENSWNSSLLKLTDKAAKELVNGAQGM